MSLKVIELNDSAVRVGDEQGLIATSPGFALAVGKLLELGDEAKRQARLHPTSSYNKFWHHLSMEPLAHPNDQVRHFADLAYAHLLHLAELAEIDDDIIFAVPGNFTHQQLAILLGLTRQSPFNAVGVVDSAVVGAVNDTSQEKSVIFADIQLHQVVLTKMMVVDQRLNTDSVIEVPGVGTQNFMELMMELVTGLFIQQCRFNPQHNAESEQQLYNQLPLWLQQDDDDKNSLLLELKTDSAVYQAKMPKQSLVDILNGYYKKIEQQLAALTAEQQGQVLISQAMGELPGLVAALSHFSGLKVADETTISKNCLQYQEVIAGDAGRIHLVSALPLPGKASTNIANTATQECNNNESPTHALYSNQAFGLGELEIRNSATLNGQGTAANTLTLSIGGLPEFLGKIDNEGDQFFLVCGEHGAVVNDKKVAGKQKLNLGDRVSFDASLDDIRLIQVRNG
ncbi:MAG: hypothetical protein QGG67_15730 [Gammaproteobacteria bacterium]|jgi:hypothetical protein|nr:hypothetical protein [Gammaproteobacteria bacterium]